MKSVLGLIAEKKLRKLALLLKHSIASFQTEKKTGRNSFKFLSRLMFHLRNTGTKTQTPVDNKSSETFIEWHPSQQKVV